MQLQLKDWWQNFLAARDLSEPTGAPIYSYRVTDQEFTDLEAMLQERLRTGLLICSLPDYARLTSQFPALFVLYAAEWWRRRYDGTGWSWEPILEELGVAPDAWNQNQRSDCVERGLRAWNLGLTAGTGMRFLGSIAFQGGLPMQLLASARGNIGRVLSRVMRLASSSGVEAISIQGWIESLSTYLPKSYRQAEIFALLAEVVLCVLRLKQEASLQSPIGAIEALDKKVPDWRNRFPFPVEDAQAQGLIEQLIRDAAEATVVRPSRRLIVERRLERAIDGSWQFVSDVLLPDQIASADLASLFDVEPHWLTRTLVLKVSRGGAHRELGLRKLVGKESYLVDRLTLDAIGENAIAEHTATLSATSGDFRHVPIARGEGLSVELPWLFEGTPGQEGNYRFSRQGGGSIGYVEALVCTPPSWTVDVMEGGAVDEAGSLSKLGWTIWRVTGGARISDGAGHAFRVRCGQAAAAEEHFEWGGSRLWETFSSPPLAFRGAPKLYRVSEEGVRQAVHGAVAWRFPASGVTTVPTGRFGPVETWWPSEGELRFRSRLALLPDRASIKVEGGDTPAHGRVIFEQFALAGVQSAHPDVHVRFEPNGMNGVAQVEYRGTGNPPEWCELSLTWPRNPDAAVVRVPFPAKGARAFNAQGKLLGPAARLSLADLRGVRMVGFLGDQSKAELQVGLHTGSGLNANSSISVPITSAVGESRVEVRLLDYTDLINRLLAGSDGLDSTVSIRLRAGPGALASVRVSRYACELERHAVSRCVELPADISQELDPDAIGQLPLRMLQINDPGKEAIELVPQLSEGVATGRWQVPDQLSPGPWLIYPAVNSSVQFRPMIWPVIADDATEREIPVTVPGLSDALAIGIEPKRIEALDTAIAELAANFSHPDWESIDKLAAQLGHLPLSTLDVWRCFASAPEAMAALALRFSDQPDGFVERFSTELPMLWETIPFEAWSAAMSNLLDQCVRQFGAELGRQMCDLHLTRRLQALGTTSPAINAVLWVARSHSVGPVAPDLAFFQAPGTDRYLGERLFVGESCEFQKVLQKATSSQRNWPMGFARGLESAKTRDLTHLFGKALATYHETVMNLPVALAISVATGKLPDWCKSVRDIQEIRAIQAFAPEWFAEAFDTTFQRCICHQLITLDR